MTFPRFLRATPLHLLTALAAAAGCGSSVVDGSGGGGTTAGTGTGGGGSSFDACTGPGQCVLVANGCCGTCGMPGPGSLASVNQAQASAFQMSVCPNPPPCPECAQQPNPDLFAFCEPSGHCLIGDVHTNPVSACTTDADCTLRFGSDCCEACEGNSSQLVALNKNSDLHALVCAPDTGCPGCVPMYPAGAAAVCDAGHCAVVFANPGGPSTGP
jgi:hypothetical protein